MPVYDVTDPTTGMSVSLTGDSPPTERELIDIFAQVGGGQAAPIQQQAPQQPVQQTPAGSPRAKRAQTLRSESESRVPSEAEGLPEIGSAPELNEFSMPAFQASLGLLATGDTKGAQGVIQQQFPNATFRVDEQGNTIADLPSGSFALNKPGLSGQDVARAAFSGAAFTPAGRATTIGSGLLGAGATAAGIQGASAATGGGVSPEQAAIETALGPIGPIARTTLQGARKFATGTIPESAKEVIETGVAQGIPVLTTDVVPPKGIVGALAQKTGELIPIAGTGGIRAGQREAREELATSIANQFPSSTSEDIFRSLKEGANKVKRAAGQRINDITARLTTRGAIPLNSTNTAIDDAIATLDRPGALKDQQTIDTLTTIRDSLNADNQTFDILRDNRTAVRELAESSDPLIRSQLPSKSKAQLLRVKNAITKDLDSFVESNEGERGLSRYKRADEVYANEASRLTKSRLKNVLDKGIATPEAVETMLFSKKPSEVKILRDSLTTEGRSNARAALIQRAVEKAGGIDNISPTRLGNELGKLKDNTAAFFTGTDRKVLNGIQKLLVSTKRAQEAAVAPPTGQVLVPGLAGAAAATSPVLTGLFGGGAGLLARAYESAPVRNALLRISGASNDTAIARGIDQLSNVLTPIAEGAAALERSNDSGQTTQ